MLNKRPSVFQKICLNLLVCLLFAGAAFAVTAFAVISDYDFLALSARGSLEQIVDAIDDGADVNVSDDIGRTPLIYAATFNPDPEVVRVLIEAGADVNAQIEDVWSPEDGTTALMAAMTRSAPEVIRALVGAGADVNARNRLGWTPLLLAAGSVNSNPETIRTLIDAGAYLNAVSMEGSSVLMLAAERASDPEIITILLSSGADPIHRQIITPGRGANVELFALDYAMDNVNLQDTEALRRLKEETGSALLAEERAIELVELAQTGSLQQIEEAIENGANVNMRLQLENGRTPFMMAALNRNVGPEAIRALIDAGGDVHLRNNTGYTVLMYAADFNPYAEVAAAIIEAGADVNAVCFAGFTPLMIAAFKNTPEVVAALLEHGADPTAKNELDRNNMAIDYAGRNRRLQGTDVLRELEEKSRR